MQIIQIDGNQHIPQPGWKGPAFAASSEQQQDRSAPGVESAQTDTFELSRPSIQTIVATLDASLAMELPFQPSRTPLAPQESSETATPTAANPEPPVSAPASAEATAAGEIPADTEEAEGAEGASAGATAELSAEEQREVDTLKDRDREVRAHEQAHMAARPLFQGRPLLRVRARPR